MIWRTAGAQQSVIFSPPLPSPPPFPSPSNAQKKTKEGTFDYRNISGDEFIFYYGFK